MTWTKLGDEASDAMAPLSDAAFRTHIEALMWSNRRLLDFTITKRDLYRFAETEDPEQTAAELVAAEWWRALPDGGWYVGCRFPHWQLERVVVEQRKEQNALRQRRHRLHRAGDHQLCGERCVTRDRTRDVVRDVVRDETRDPGRDGTGRDGPREEALSDDELLQRELWGDRFVSAASAPSSAPRNGYASRAHRLGVEWGDDQ